MNNWPERHVEHLLAGYASGQLNARQAARVRRHTALCADCRARLADHERLADDLHLMLRHSVTPSPAEVESWWQAIRVRPARRAARRHVAPVLAPVLAALLIAVPILTGGRHAAQPAQAAATAALPVISRTAEPPHNETSIPGVMPIASDTPAVRTPSPEEQNALLTPVPPAPTTVDES